MSLAQYNHISEKVIGAAFSVGNTLGYGFLENVYENAMAYELEKQGLNFSRQHAIKVHYNGLVVGDYIADFLVENSIIVELKAVKSLDDTHLAQCINYLKATKKKLGLLINFGSGSVTIKRVANDKK